MTEAKYTKHYFIEGERVATKIGSGFTNIPFKPYEEPPGGYQFDPNDKAEQLYQMVSRDIECVQYEGEWEINTMLEPAYFESEEYEENQYFYHPDHLGSSSFITDAIGYATQHLQYLPFGELFVNQQNSTYDTRYKFSAKELDNETGYNYFGFRYLDTDLSVWLSVDYVSNIYPSTSPYMYTLGNPIKYIDPNGLYSKDPPFTYKNYSPCDPTFWCNYDTYRDGYVSQFTVNKSLVGAGAILLTPIAIAVAPAIGASAATLGSAISTGVSTAYGATTTMLARGSLYTLSFGRSLMYSSRVQSIMGGILEIGASWATFEPMSLTLSSGYYWPSMIGTGITYFSSSQFSSSYKDFLETGFNSLEYLLSNKGTKNQGFELNLMQQDNTRTQQTIDQSIVPDLQESYNSTQKKPNYNYSFSKPSNDYHIHTNDNTKTKNVPKIEL